MIQPHNNLKRYSKVKCSGKLKKKIHHNILKWIIYINFFWIILNSFAFWRVAKNCDKVCNHNAGERPVMDEYNSVVPSLAV